MTIRPLERKGLFSTTRFNAGGSRIAYDLEKCFDLPAPAETIFDLRRNNACAFVDEVNKLFGKGKSFQIFNRELVGSETYGFRKVNVLSSRQGWTLYRDRAKLEGFTFDESSGRFSMRLGGTERSPEEQTISLEGMPKFAFLNRKHSNIHFRTPAGLYLSQGHLKSPFTYRSQTVYALRDVEDIVNP